jgi:TPR repeat protein
VNDELQRLVDLVDQGRSDAAEAWARPRAEKGDADAQFLMGYLVFGEKRVDFRKACEWLHLAAAQDHPEALFDLSRVDESQDRANTGIPRSDAQRTLLRRAADLGSARAQADLARYCATGRGGFAKDQVEARAWCSRAAEGGDTEGRAGAIDPVDEADARRGQGATAPSIAARVLLRRRAPLDAGHDAGGTEAAGEEGGAHGEREVASTAAYVLLAPRDARRSRHRDQGAGGPPVDHDDQPLRAPGAGTSAHGDGAAGGAVAKELQNLQRSNLSQRNYRVSDGD